MPHRFLQRLVLSGAAVAVCCTAQGSVSGVALAATPYAASRYGSFSLTGPISGTLAVAASTCSAATSTADVQFSWFGKQVAVKGVAKGSIASMELDLQGLKYGKRGVLKNSKGSPPFLSFGVTSPLVPTPVEWQSVSGTYSTSAKGAGGALDVVLSPAAGGRDHIVVKGTWQGCKAAKS